MSDVHTNKNQDVRLGLITGRWDFSAFVSVGRLFHNTVKVLTERFSPIVFDPDAYAGRRGFQSALDDFLAQVNVVFQPLGGFFVGERNPRIPVLFYALAAMPMGGEFLFRLKHALRNIDCAVFSSSADRRMYENLVVGPAMGAYVVPFGVDCTVFRPQDRSRTDEIRRRYGVPPQDSLLLHAGRLNVQKNIHALLRMFREIQALNPHCTLIVAGDPDGLPFVEFEVSGQGYREYLTTLIKAYGIGDRVVLTGGVDDRDIVSLYSAADVFINCTIHHAENFGFAQVEAMACGTPVVCSNWGGLQDTVAHGETGFHMDTILTNNGIKLDWASGVRDIVGLLDNPSRLRQMSEHAFQHVRKTLSLEVFGDKLEEAVRDARRRMDHIGQVETAASFRFHPIAAAFNLHERFSGEQGANYHLVFSRDGYELYRFLIAPYSSRAADDVDVNRCRGAYFPCDVTIDRHAGILEVHDPIWPRKYVLDDVEVDVLSGIDRGRTIADMLDGTGVGKESLVHALAKFNREGVIVCTRDRQQGADGAERHAENGSRVASSNASRARSSC